MSVTAARDPVLSVQGLTIGTSRQTLVRDLTFSVGAGEVLGIVGESGSGKTLTAYAIAGLLPSDVSVQSGAIRLDGRSLTDIDSTERRALAGGRIGMVFQNPLSSFNPVRTIGSMLIESAMRHRALPRTDARRHAIEALTAVRLPEPQTVIDAYPHQLSGGQRQRAMIALARLNDPVLLIADEPTTALDPTVQLQILALLHASVAANALVMITHDLGVAAAMCHRLLVMHRGESVEQGDTRQVLDKPRHPYTRQLLAAVRTLAFSRTTPLQKVSGQ
jgi:ABC-type glutathione transport system ATPase component